MKTSQGAVPYRGTITGIGLANRAGMEEDGHEIQGERLLRGHSIDTELNNLKQSSRGVDRLCPGG